MTPQALHNATHGLRLPPLAPVPSHNWILYLILLLGCVAAITYPWSRK